MLEGAFGWCVLGAQRRKMGCKSLLWGCWGWEGCDSKACAAVVLHWQADVCAGVCLCCPAAALPWNWVLKALTVGTCCSFVPPASLGFSLLPVLPWSRNASACYCVSSVKYSSCLLVWDRSVSSVWNFVCSFKEMVCFFQHEAVRGTKHIDSSKCWEL